MYRLDRHGAGLCFEDVGAGAPPLVLIHDLGSDHSSFAPQIEHFRRKHRVVAVDLPGHGASDKLEKEYSIPGLADDIAWLSYELGVYAPFVVGHGLGGMIAVEVAAHYPDLPAAVVALDSLGRNSLDWNAETAVAACRAPILCIDPGTGAAGLGRLPVVCTRVIVDSAGEAGHSLHLRYPNQINAMIDSFLVRVARPTD